MSLFEKSEQEVSFPYPEKLNWKLTWRENKTSMQIIGIFIFLGLLSSLGGGMIVPGPFRFCLLPLPLVQALFSDMAAISVMRTPFALPLSNHMKYLFSIVDVDEGKEIQ